ncbi:hypothetical protein GMOD_00007470 [Pyrenophora seminiperda CCB06]|uniref:Uncharacterized protein n=1 Tax=Pyrenophora seminiperda CCB06 TaxID=1302712 RepID=A0A3M7MD86_9PLEO|nr:hypothetical protein GMOD_00007470 [Pyrenophora seminiperda CCB06]
MPRSWNMRPEEEGEEEGEGAVMGLVGLVLRKKAQWKGFFVVGLSQVYDAEPAARPKWKQKGCSEGGIRGANA